MRYFCGGSYCFMSWRLFFVLLAPYVCFHIFSEWPPIEKKAAHSAYDMFSWYKYLECVFSPRFLEWESFSDCACS